MEGGRRHLLCHLVKIEIETEVVLGVNGTYIHAAHAGWSAGPRCPGGHVVGGMPGLTEGHVRGMRHATMA